MSRLLRVQGLMSGTSADGIDSAILNLPERPRLDDVTRVRHFHWPFTPEQRRRVFELFDPAQTSSEIVCRANFELGEWFAKAALAAIADAGMHPGDVDLIGSHGQTIFHAPPVAGSGQGGSTLQIGEPSVIAERTGITTVADFRVRDMAAGGQGAPLVSYVDALLFRHARRTRVLLNLGGIANVTVLPPLERAAAPLAFDTGPANVLMDALAERLTDQPYDADGRLAASGTADESLLAELLSDPYFSARPPKTTGREHFGVQYAEQLLSRIVSRGGSGADALATALALTARSVAGAILEHASMGQEGIEVIAGGGGTRNPVLMAELRRRVAPAALSTTEDHGMLSQAKEALSFAILAAAAIRGEPNTVPECTGAGHAVVMGKIVPGANYRQLMKMLF